MVPGLAVSRRLVPRADEAGSGAILADASPGHPGVTRCCSVVRAALAAAGPCAHRSGSRPGRLRAHASQAQTAIPASC